jgi:hypothetical protein
MSCRVTGSHKRTRTGKIADYNGVGRAKKPFEHARQELFLTDFGLPTLPLQGQLTIMEDQGSR